MCNFFFPRLLPVSDVYTYSQQQTLSPLSQVLYLVSRHSSPLKAQVNAPLTGYDLAVFLEVQRLQGHWVASGL
jgi:hypothetical protein